MSRYQLHLTLAITQYSYDSTDAHSQNKEEETKKEKSRKSPYSNKITTKIAPEVWVFQKRRFQEGNSAQASLYPNRRS
jgi:hypothetical protein